MTNQPSNQAETILICNRCGEQAFRKGEDAIDYCDECGVVEGNTHEEPNPTKNEPALRQAWDELEADIRANERQRLHREIFSDAGAADLPEISRLLNEDSKPATAPDATSADSDQKGTRSEPHVTKGTDAKLPYREEIKKILPTWKFSDETTEEDHEFDLDQLQSLITRARRDELQSLYHFRKGEEVNNDTVLRKLDKRLFELNQENKA